MLLLAALVLACGMRSSLHMLIPASHADADDDAEDMIRVPSRVRIVDGRTELVLSAAAVRNAGIATSRPGPAPARTSVQAYGQILDPATLIELASRYRSASAQRVSAQARVSAARAALARVRMLYQDRRNMSAAQLQAAQSAYRIDAAGFAAAQSSVAALGATIAQSWGPVLAAAVTRNGSLLQRLTARRDFLVSVTLPSGVVLARAPATARALLPGGAAIALDFVSAGTTVDPLVQGARYYYRATAAPGVLAGLSLTVTLAASGAQAALVVPESAVVWLQGEPWIYCRSGARIFVRQRIAPAWQTRDGGYVVPGLSPDTEVVIRGAQLLLSEEFRAQVETQDND